MSVAIGKLGIRNGWISHEADLDFCSLNKPELDISAMSVEQLWYSDKMLPF